MKKQNFMNFLQIKDYLIGKYWDWTDMRWQQFPGHRILKDIKWILQKIFKGYNDVNLWNLDCHLAKIILKRLKEFKKMKRCGYPSAPYMNFPKIQCQEDWEKILDDIVKGFECYLIAENLDYDFTTKKYEELQENIDSGLELFAEYFQYLWD